MTTQPLDDLYKTTESLCPECGERLPAVVLRRGRELHLRVECARHGVAETLFKKDIGFYAEVSTIADETPDVARSITPQCTVDLANLACPVCFADANAESVPALSTEFILERLSQMPAKKLEVTLLGGEPTLREDLPEMTRRIVDMGFKLKLITNGLRLENRDYAKSLRDAGLEWLILQFDGFRPEIYRTLRGRDLLERKLRIVESVGELGFKTCLAMMVVAGVNDDQIGEMIRYGFRQKGVKHIALLPASSLGRDIMGLGESHLHAEDLMDLIAAQTDGRVVRDDYLTTMRLMKRVHNVTGHIDFKQRSCFFPMPLIGDEHDFVPASRLVTPGGISRHMRYWGKASFIARNLFSIDASEMPDHFLYLSIEKLYGARGIDLQDAGQCNTLYLTREGLTPSCIYNAMYRGSSPSCGSY
ncbi:MAG: radical SAM protein [Deltaproteobacteria bacterium]|nr:radical SAM protein [Deltaproteobacteria bacterium]